MALASSSSSSSSGPSNRFAPSGWAETPSAGVGGCCGVWNSGSRARTGEWAGGERIGGRDRPGGEKREDEWKGVVAWLVGA
nr:unnamed protein product [Digitaria exilis]